jgi:hypothetical protein
VSTVYCSQSGYREDDFRAYLWKSTDYGKTWKSIVGNLPDETINVVREDPENDKILYVGTDLGVWITFDGGEHWDSLHGGIPTTPVHDLVIQEQAKELVAASHARSAWILPLKTILTLTDEIRQKPLTVFPVDSVRVAPNLALRSRDPYDLRDVEPPKLAVSFYAAAAGEGKVRLLDKSGAVVKETSLKVLTGFNFTSLELQLKAGKPGTVDASKRTVKSAEEALKDPYADERPVYVAPGDYNLEVTVGAQKVTVQAKVTGG